MATETVALMLLVPSARVEELRAAQLCERFRSQFFIDYGIRIPQPQLRGADSLPLGQVAVLINEVRADQFDTWRSTRRCWPSTRTSTKSSTKPSWRR